MASNVATINPNNPGATAAPAPARDSGSVDDGYLVYPADMKDTQDRIKFSVWEVFKPNLASKPKDFQLKEPGFNIISGSGYGPVFLPIQSGISDNNEVDWAEGKLNEFERRAVNSSLRLMNGTTDLGQNIQGEIGKIMAAFKNDKNLGGLGRLYLAEQAVGVQGLLSRATGNVLNPNLELLFNGPTLRPFYFAFKLSPRNKKEATRVKKIIKFFKQNMVVKKVAGDLFLDAPYAFGIEYQKGVQADTDYNMRSHPSIGLIKRCALRSCTVDYTPLGSYMTYEDSDATMVSYNISLQFQEIIPVYSSDYDDKHDIGY